MGENSCLTGRQAGQRSSAAHAAINPRYQEQHQHESNKPCVTTSTKTSPSLPYGGTGTVTLSMGASETAASHPLEARHRHRKPGASRPGRRRVRGAAAGACWGAMRSALQARRRLRHKRHTASPQTWVRVRHAGTGSPPPSLCIVASCPKQGRHTQQQRFA